MVKTSLLCLLYSLSRTFQFHFQIVLGMPLPYLKWFYSYFSLKVVVLSPFESVNIYVGHFPLAYHVFLHTYSSM